MLPPVVTSYGRGGHQVSVPSSFYTRDNDRDRSRSQQSSPLDSAISGFQGTISQAQNIGFDAIAELSNPDFQTGMFARAQSAGEKATQGALNNLGMRMGGDVSSPQYARAAGDLETAAVGQTAGNLAGIQASILQSLPGLAGQVAQTGSLGMDAILQAESLRLQQEAQQLQYMLGIFQASGQYNYNSGNFIPDPRYPFDPFAGFESLGGNSGTTTITR